jgi:hypothetical protein
VLAGPTAGHEVPGYLVVSLVHAVLQRGLESGSHAGDQDRVADKIELPGLIDAVCHPGLHSPA